MNRKDRRAAAKINGVKRATTQAEQNRINAAVAALQSGEQATAETILRDLLASEPRHAEALHLLGLTLANTRRAEEGIQLLRQATTLSPQTALYWNNLAAA